MEITKKINSYKWLILSLFGGMIARFISLNQSLWMDEAISAKVVKYFSFVGIITDFIKADTHPPLYYELLKIWTNLFGYSEIALRMPSVIFGLLTIIVVYELGKMKSAKTAVYASLLTAFSPLLIYYSQEARMYSMTVFLVSLCFMLFYRRKWLLFSISLLALGMTDYLPLIILFPLWIITLSGKDKYDIKKFLISHIPLIIFFAVWLPIFNIQRSSTMASLSSLPGWADLVGKTNLKNIELVWIKFLIGRINFSPAVIYAVMVMGVSIPVFVALFSRKNFKGAWDYYVWFIVPIAISLLVAIKIPGFSYFRLIFCLPALLLIVSYEYSNIKKGWLILMLLLIFEGFFTAKYLFDQSFWREDWRGAVGFIESRIRPGEKVYISYDETFTPYVWYAKKPELVKTFKGDPIINENSIYTLDYLMDLTDPGRANYAKLKDMGYINTEVYNYRGVGQVRFWTRN